jgi:hybrid cluster-associated redox disulfide protein
VKEQHTGLNGRIAALITERVGSMWAFYVAAFFQFGWIGLAQAGVIRFDPYAFAFLLFLSSVAQLIFMFIIMVGEEVLGRAGDKRAEQTYLDREAVLQECQRLQEHFPATARVFIGRRMHCVGCEVSRFETLDGAAQIYRQALDPLLADLRDAAGQAD